MTSKKAVNDDVAPPISFGQWIGNQFLVDSDDGAAATTISVENPTTGAVIGTVPAGCAADAKTALELAASAQPSWSQRPVKQRAQLLRALATVIRTNRDLLIKTLVAEQAKVHSLAAVEIDVTADYFEYYAGLAYTVAGEILPSDNVGEHIYVHYAPIGVAVGICPWNFPFFVMARKLAPALLSGCCCVVKTSELTPLTSFRFAECIMKAAPEIIDNDLLPPGVIAILTGYGHTIGEALTSSSIPGIISMTGSVSTGQKIMVNAAAHMTKVNLELGGKAPCIVMADADLEKAATAIVASRVIFGGQVCNCAERVYVQSSIYDAFVELLVTKMKASRCGDPMEAASDFCSLISAPHRDKVDGMVQRAVEAGATVLCGGKPTEGTSACYGYEPTVLTNVQQDSEIVQQETFGPILPVLKFETFDDALGLANDSEYGLASSVFTNDYRIIERARTELLFGETYINRFHFEAIQGFHAGWRKSGLGGADGKHGLMEYFNTKVIYVQR